VPSVMVMCPSRWTSDVLVGLLHFLRPNPPNLLEQDSGDWEVVHGHLKSGDSLHATGD